jgi:lincosamide nucleotidyltransferase A/C/D/E
MAIQPNGDGIREGMQGETFLHAATDRTTGQIGGRPVTVATADRLTQLRRGYEPRAVDLHDLAVLRSLQTH